MRRDEAPTILRAHKAELEQLGVTTIWIFGSAARDKTRPDSDVDILVKPSRPLGLEFFGLQDKLEEWLGCKVDLGRPDSLRPWLKERVLAEAVRAA
ncbi:MAG: nucleotidyltransferase family protein [Deinococcus sp.]|nr:nucleotidyltransferase family protein [Deinococcus sp.]